jgi:hypothetical protein
MLSQQALVRLHSLLLEPSRTQARQLFKHQVHKEQLLQEGSSQFRQMELGKRRARQMEQEIQQIFKLLGQVLAR